MPGAPGMGSAAAGSARRAVTPFPEPPLDKGEPARGPRSAAHAGSGGARSGSAENPFSGEGAGGFGR